MNPISPLKSSAKIVHKGVKRLQLSDGLSMAYQEWGASDTSSPKRILALHGWLDNSNSFNHLGPYLAAKGFHVLALDHIGHGLSDHLATGAVYNILRTTSCVNDFVYALGWRNFHLMGHSMGAAISMMYAATMHEFVDKLVLIDGFGPVTELPEDTASNLRKALDSERRMRQRGMAPKVYPTVGDAITARMSAVSSYPGAQFLSKEAAAELVARAAVQIKEQDGDYQDLRDEALGPVSFRHDKRLVLPSYLYHSDDQVMSYVHSITAHTLLVTGKNGWPIDASDMETRKAAMLKKGNLTHLTMEGSHHLHLDPQHRGAVADAVGSFLSAARPPRKE